MAYTKTSWAAGNRVSIERLNKIEDGINLAAQQNTSNQGMSSLVQAMLTDTNSNIIQANQKVADGSALLETITPPGILVDKWGIFDGGSAASSTASTVTRTLSGFVTRANDATLFKNNGNNIQILQAGRYLIARSVRLSGARAIVFLAMGLREAFAIGFAGSTFRTLHTAAFMEVIDAAAGTQIEIRAQAWGNSSGMSLTFTDGKIAIKKVG